MMNCWLGFFPLRGPPWPQILLMIQQLVKRLSMIPTHSQWVCLNPFIAQDITINISIFLWPPSPEMGLLEIGYIRPSLSKLIYIYSRLNPSYNLIPKNHSFKLLQKLTNQDMMNREITMFWLNKRYLLLKRDYWFINTFIFK